MPTKIPSATVTHEDIRHLCGRLADWKMAWAEGQDDVIGPAGHPLTGRAALLYEIITADEDIWGEGDRT